jgi:hypothetical protein
MSVYVGPVFREHGACPRVDFYLPADVVSGPLEAKVEAADAGEEATDRHAAPRFSRASMACACRSHASSQHRWPEPTGRGRKRQHFGLAQRTNSMRVIRSPPL